MTIQTIDARLIGGPTLQLRYVGLNILTDPTFDEPGAYPGGATLYKTRGPAVSSDEVGRADLVLLSHDQHFDNLDHSGRALLQESGVVLSTPDAAERIPGVIGLTPWQTISVGDVHVTAVPALHGPEGAEALSGVVTGFVLRAADAPVVYVSGDNASVDLVSEIADRVPDIDVAILFAGAANVGRFGDIDLTLNARTAVQTAQRLGEARIVVVHAEDWEHFSETPERLATQFRRAGLTDRLTIPVRGEWFAIG
ncbi:MBL fold metallo-hydrolase [Microbacterium sp. ASV49]|uniref:MBL fold metallo-hydrolase n=1 Tax=Microbacterium candidum TaxID=3041922 RepID=A0ABT7N2J8_9MICO|nr:MBL fold metallo-hydrolase [Microbacterium sp. ASV49]MDL9980937.1 MBL fold metallo-hydrolase [Microbacterium sp. ASV49]